MIVSSQHREGRPVLQTTSSPQDASRILARTRRDFLRTAAGVTLGSALMRPAWARAVSSPSRRTVVVVTFGGGGREQETFPPEGQETIPHLRRELIRQASFFTQVVNRGILAHYVATAS